MPLFEKKQQVTKSKNEIPKRLEVKRALRLAGLSSRQTDALLRGGWAALVGHSQAEADELREGIDRLQKLVGLAAPAARE
jgi:hypothetical protein